MTNIINLKRGLLRGSSALQALALLGAGVAGATMLAAPAAAQDYQNVTASGSVQGTDGNPIAEATIRITSNEQGFSRTVTTNSGGSYRVPQLPTGNYTFEVSAAGFETFTDPNVYLSNSGAANQFTLAAEGAAAEIVVRAGRQTVADFDRTTTGASINVSDLANRVPVSRDLNAIVQLSPGTAVGDSAFGNLPAIAGSSVAENAYFVNGLNVTNFRTFLGPNEVPFEFYDTIDIKNGGYQAEFGRSTGGVVNATTKSGTNEFHAGTVVTYAPRQLRDTSPNTLTADNSEDFLTDLRSDFYVSGPLIKDHLFFYGLYESRYLKSAGVPTGGVGSAGGGTITSTGEDEQFGTLTDKSPFFAGKIDAVITDGQRLEFTYFNTKAKTFINVNNYVSDTNTQGSFKGSEINETGGENYVGRYTGTFTDWFTLSAAYGKSDSRDNVISSTPDVPYVTDNRINPPAAIGNFTNLVETHEDQRKFYRADADVYFDLLGSHHIRFGYDREDLKTTGTSGYPSGEAYQYFTATAADGGNYVGDYAVGRTFEGNGSFKAKNEAFYIQDSWSLLDDRLNLQFGIRNDRFKNSNVEGVSFYKSGDQWGPRLGFTLDPIGDNRTKVYGSFGRYFLPIAANTNIRLAGAEYDVDTYYRLLGVNEDNSPILGAPLAPGDIADVTLRQCIRTSDTACRIRANGQVTPTTNTVAKNLKPQSMDEYIIGMEQRIGQHITVGVYGTYRELNRALEDAAIDQAALAYCQANDLAMNTDDQDGCADIYTGFSQYVLLNPGEDSEITLFPVAGESEGRTVLLTADQLGYPSAKRKYEALTITFDREFDGVWSLAGSYTYSKTLGNYEGAVKSDVGQADPGLTQDFDQPGLTVGSYGYLPGDHRHNFKLYGSYQPLEWLQLGANFTALSPRHYGCIGFVDESLDPFASAYGAAGNYCPLDENGEILQGVSPADFVVVPRGSAFNSDWQTSLDISASVKLPTDVFQGVIRFDVFNVLNSKGVIDLNEFGTDDSGGARPDYRAPITYQNPRYARIQLQLRF